MSERRESVSYGMLGLALCLMAGIALHGLAASGEFGPDLQRAVFDWWGVGDFYPSKAEQKR